LKQLLTCLIAGALCLAAAVPWQKKDPEQWTSEDIQRVTSNSPWAQVASATFPDPRRNDEPQSVYTLPGAAQAGMAGPRGASDGHWDGGVGKNTGGGLLPTLPVVIRWDSALPVRQAWWRSKQLRMRESSLWGKEGPPQESKHYIVTVEGLIPAGRYSGSGQLETKSSSDDTTGSATNPEPVLEGLMANSKLLVRGQAPITCENVTMDPDTGAVHLFFPRSTPIQRSDKEVAFATRFGSLTVEKHFRLNDMIYRGKLEL
jgi:hypothetical protein